GFVEKRLTSKCMDIRSRSGFEKSLLHGHIFSGNRKTQRRGPRRGAVTGGSVDIGLAREQQFEFLSIPFSHRFNEERFTRDSSSIRVRLRFDESFHQADLAEIRGNGEGGGRLDPFV